MHTWLGCCVMLTRHVCNLGLSYCWNQTIHSLLPQQFPLAKGKAVNRPCLAASFFNSQQVIENSYTVNSFRMFSMTNI